MVKKITLAVAMVAFVALPAFAAVQNVKVGGDLKTTSVVRQNFDSTQNRDRQNEILSQVHLNVAADLTDNVSTMISLVNERVWGANTNSTSDIDLDAAYVTMKEFLYSPLTLTLGRQPLAYGNQLIIGDGDAYSNVDDVYSTLSDITGGVNFDAIKAVLSYDPLTVDVFASRISNGSVAPSVITGKNVNLYGVNANYKMGDKMSTVVEGYVFAQLDDSTDTTGVGQTQKSTRTYVPGLRVSTNPIEGLNVQLEGAYQLGSVWNANALTMQSRAGTYALQAMANYALPVMKDMKPVVGVAYTLKSGEKEPQTAATGRSDWNNMYANQNVGRIFHCLGYDGSNSQLATLSLEVAPVKDLTTKASLNGLWLAQKEGYSAGSTNSSKYLGSEADLDLTYAYTEDVTFGVSAGLFMTGKKYFPDATASEGNQNATQLLSSVNVAF